MIKSTSESNIPVFVGCMSSTNNLSNNPGGGTNNRTNNNNNSRPGSRNSSVSGPSGVRAPTPLKTRQPSNSSIPIPTNNRTRTPSGSGPRGNLQRSGSNLKSPYSADGNKFGSSSALRNAVGLTRDWQQ